MKPVLPLLSNVAAQPKLGRELDALVVSDCSPHTHQRILVVEDNQSIRQLCAKALTRSGYQVDAAEDGAAGLLALRDAGHAPSHYDLIITDNEMPKLSGVDMIQQLRAEHVNLPVILASGNVSVDTKPLHLVAILPKPFSVDQLLQTVNEILRWPTALTKNHSNQFQF